MRVAAESGGGGGEPPQPLPVGRDATVGVVYSVTRFVRPTARGLATLCDACLHRGVDSHGIPSCGGGVHLCARHRTDLAIAMEDGVQTEAWVAAGFTVPTVPAMVAVGESDGG